MFKSFIIKLRQKPKVVRDQIALIIAVTFTVIVLSIWIFTIPERFTSDQNQESPSDFFFELRESISETAPDITEITTEFQELTATSTEEMNQIVIPNELPTSTASSTVLDGRSIRLTTTSPSESSATENNQ